MIIIGFVMENLRCYAVIFYNLRKDEVYFNKGGAKARALTLNCFDFLPVPFDERNAHATE